MTPRVEQLARIAADDFAQVADYYADLGYHITADHARYVAARCQAVADGAPVLAVLQAEESAAQREGAAGFALAAIARYQAADTLRGIARKGGAR